MLNTLFCGCFWMVPKWAAYLLLALVCCCYSERLNGRYVAMPLAGDWILYLAALFLVLLAGSVVALVVDQKKSE